MKLRMRARVHSLVGTAPHSVEIHETDGGYYLFSVAESGAVFADTWHQTLEEAQAQAKFQFDVDASEWSIPPLVEIADAGE